MIRALILVLALANLGYLAWAWQTDRLVADPWGDAPSFRSAGNVELLDARIVDPAQAPDSDRPESPTTGSD